MLNQIEKIKKILEANVFFHSEEYGDSGQVQVMDFNLENAAHQIQDALFKGDEEGLLTKDTFGLAWKEGIDTYQLATPSWKQNDLDRFLMCAWCVAKAQQTLTRQRIASSLPDMGEVEIRLNFGDHIPTQEILELHMVFLKDIVQAYKDKIKKWLEGWGMSIIRNDSEDTDKLMAANITEAVCKQFSDWTAEEVPFNLKSDIYYRVRKAQDDGIEI